MRGSRQLVAPRLGQGFQAHAPEIQADKQAGNPGLCCWSTRGLAKWSAYAPLVLPDLPFHDAEVLAVRLDRDGPTLELEIETFAQRPEARRVRILFSDVSDLELEGLNHQNVLFDVLEEREEDGNYRVVLQSSVGLSGTFRCRSCTVVPS